MQDKEEAYDVRVFVIHKLDISIALNQEDNPEMAAENVIDLAEHKTSILSRKTIITLRKSSHEVTAFLLDMVKKARKRDKTIILCVNTLEEGLDLFLRLGSEMCSLDVDGSDLRKDADKGLTTRANKSKPIAICIQENASYRLSSKRRFDLVVVIEDEKSSLSVAVTLLMLGKVAVIVSGQNPGEISLTTVLEAAKLE